MEKVGTHDKFFELGGHSLLGMQVVARVRNTLGVEVPLRSLLTNQTAAVFAAEVEQQRRTGEAPVEVIGRAARNRALPLYLLSRVCGLTISLTLGAPISIFPARCGCEAGSMWMR